MSSSIIITTAPTGLGHIRVTNALVAGLPEQTKAHIMGITDESISFTYHLISTNYYLRKILEFTQTNNAAEKIVTPLLTYIQTQKINDTVQQINKIIETDHPDNIIIVSTHAFIAQKISRIIRKKSISLPIYHAVIVTDDSPQRFWMVPADCIFVPSYKTKEKLSQLFKQENKTIPTIEVAPYPISPKYCVPLDPAVLYNKIEQVTPENPQKARICIPISGAAVQLDFYSTLIKELTCEDVQKECREFKFSVITKEGNYTKPFISEFRENNDVVFHIGANDFQTVQLYDRLYEQLNPPSLEITKPSEQCFKVLTNPNTLGGPLILLTEPVGRQEYDNLEYLKRFHFIPDDKTQQKLNERLCCIDHLLNVNPFPEANTWRAVRLPPDPYDAALFIINGLKLGVFFQMQKYQGYTKTEELSPEGVSIIWNKIKQQTSRPSK